MLIKERQCILCKFLICYAIQDFEIVRYVVCVMLLHPPCTLPCSTKEVFVNNQRVLIRYNDTCHFYQPPRAHHCSVNDNCIERFDHHCPWVGTTIGRVRMNYLPVYLRHAGQPIQFCECMLLPFYLLSNSALSMSYLIFSLHLLTAQLPNLSSLHLHDHGSLSIRHGVLSGPDICEAQ